MSKSDDLQRGSLRQVLSLVLLLCISGALSTPNSALARKAIRLKPNQIEISYVPPKNAAHEEIYRFVKDRQALEKFRAFLSPLRLPRKLLLKTEGCDGEVNAWYHDDAITICYEYLNDIIQNAPPETTPAGVTRTDAIMGPAVEVFFHELGHAVFDYLHTPVLGREEDAADEFAAYFLLRFGGEDSRRLIKGAAYAYNREASLPSLKKIHLLMSTVSPRNAFTTSCAWPTVRTRNCSLTWLRRDTCRRNGRNTVATNTQKSSTR